MNISQWEIFSNFFPSQCHSLTKWPWLCWWESRKSINSWSEMSTQQFMFVSVKRTRICYAHVRLRVVVLSTCDVFRLEKFFAVSASFIISRCACPLPCEIDYASVSARARSLSSGNRCHFWKSFDAKAGLRFIAVAPWKFYSRPRSSSWENLHVWVKKIWGWRITRLWNEWENYYTENRHGLMEYFWKLYTNAKSSYQTILPWLHFHKRAQIKEGTFYLYRTLYLFENIIGVG